MHVWKTVSWCGGANSLWCAGRTKERAGVWRGPFTAQWEFLLWAVACCLSPEAEWWHEGDPVFNLLPVLPNEEVFPVSSSYGHHLIRETFKHLLYRLHFFLAMYANFYTGIPVDFNGPSAMLVFVIGKTKAPFPTLGKNEIPPFPRRSREEKLRRWGFNKVILFADFIFIIKCQWFAWTLLGSGFHDGCLFSLEAGWSLVQFSAECPIHLSPDHITVHSEHWLVRWKLNIICLKCKPTGSS